MAHLDDMLEELELQRVGLSRVSRVWDEARKARDGAQAVLNSVEHSLTQCIDRVRWTEKRVERLRKEGRK